MSWISFGIGVVQVLLRLGSYIRAAELATATASNNARILGGVEAAPHEFPSLLIGGFPCQATLINAEWALTASHCLHNERLPITFHAGRISGAHSEPDQQSRNATKLFIHPGYTHYDAQNDIGLMKFDSPFELNSIIQPMTLPPKGYDPTLECAWAVGFGNHCPVNRTEPCPGKATVFKVDLPIRENSFCEGFFPEQFNSTTFICAGGYEEGGKDTCHGDSGGPMFLIKDGKQVQVGVTAWGPDPCGQPGVPAAYARVTTYLDWIAETIRSES